MYTVYIKTSELSNVVKGGVPSVFWMASADAIYCGNDPRTLSELQIDNDKMKKWLAGKVNEHEIEAKRQLLKG